MRKSRWLALFFATQFVPFAAYAQVVQSNPTTNPPAQSDDSDDEDEDEPSATPPASSDNPGTGEASGSDETADTATDEVAETPDARRTRMLPRYSSLDGSIGLLHTSSAMLGSAGSFRFGLVGEYFSTSDFLRPASLSGTTFVGGPDDARHVGGTLTLSYSPLDFLEIFSSVRAYANANNRERPSLFQVLGDSTLGVKAAFRVARGFYLGGSVAAYLLNRSGDVGLLLDSTSLGIRLVSSLDLKELTGSVPVRIHLNGQYYFDNSASIVSDVEQRRREANPTYSASRCAMSNDPVCYLEISRVERFALGINRQDNFSINLGAEAELPYVHPFVEWSIAVPINRQGYACFDPAGGAAPGGASDDDGCRDTSGFSSTPSRLTLGARVLPPVRGLSGILAVDIATSGSSTFVRELAPTTPWQFFLGAAFAYDTHPEVQRVEVPGPERIVTRDVDRTPPGGTVNGTVRDSEAHTGIGRAYVTFTGHPDLHILATGADGSFHSGHIPPGEYRVHVEADGYNPNDCTFTIAAPAAAPTETPAAGAAATPAVPAAPAAPTVVTTTCDLRPLPRRGNISGQVVSSQGAAAVANATVTVAPAAGFTVPAGTNAPTEQVVTTDAMGAFTVSDLLAGSYTVSVGPTPQHMGTTPQPLAVEPRRTADVNVTATRRPARPAAVLRGGLIIIARQVHFQVNSAEILPDSNALLEEIADVIRRNPTITSVEIQGHTDNTGNAQNNMTLSQSRSEAVRDALVRMGVATDHLTARGLGQTRPLRPNLTVVGRTANRRVEFHVSRAQ
jgi:OmpA-OmpF porin, OOP family